MVILGLLLVLLGALAILAGLLAIDGTAELLGSEVHGTALFLIGVGAGVAVLWGFTIAKFGMKRGLQRARRASSSPSSRRSWTGWRPSAVTTPTSTTAAPTSSEAVLTSARLTSGRPAPERPGLPTGRATAGRRP